MIGLLVVAGHGDGFRAHPRRQDRQQGATDSAAAAGVRVLDGGDGNTRPFQGACTALAYLKANDVELDGTKLTGSWKYGNLAPVTGDPCVPGSAVYDDTTCVPSNTATWAWFSGTADAGRISVDIKTGYTFPDATLVPGTTAKAFPEDATVSDPGVASQGGCDQLAVVMQETEKPGLGSLATSSSLTTSVRSVGRLTLNSTSEAAAALVLLERSGCPALTLNSAAAGVLVKGSGATPGSIHADSNGSVGCSAGTPVLQGNHSNAVIAEPAVTGSPARAGTITTVAGTGVAPAVSANATDGAARVCAKTATGTCAAATGRTTIGRGPVDRRYLTGVTTALNAAAAAFNLTPATAAAAGYKVVSNCTPTWSGPETSVFVDRPGTASGGGVFPNATTVVFNGKVTGTMSIPNAQRVYVKGVAGGVTLTGGLRMNTGGSATCAARGAGGPRAQLVIGRRRHQSASGSDFHFCSTTVIMAEGWNTVCPIPTVKPALGTPGMPPFRTAARAASA